MPSEKELFDLGLGNVGWWGLSPFVPLSNYCLRGRCEDSKDLLIIGSGDGRYFLLEGGDHHFFVLEQKPECYARQIMLLAILRDDSVEIEDTSRDFLELFGNLELRSSLAMRIRQKAKALRRDLQALRSGEDAHLAKTVPNIDLSRLRHKDLDALEGIFKFWSREESAVSVDVRTIWDQRLRHFLKDRYDAKDGAFDQDYFFGLVDRGGACVSHTEYCHWRRTGNAFVWRDEADTDPEERKWPNLTILSTLIVTERGASRRSQPTVGYWGDIITGPFVSFGLESNRQLDLQETRLKERTSQQIALTRVQDCLQALREKGTWSKITFLPFTTSVEAKCQLQRLKCTCDLVFVSCNSTHLIMDGMGKGVLKDEDSILLVETSLFLLQMDRSSHERFKTRVVEMGKENGLEEAETPHSCVVQLLRSDRKPE